MSYRIALENMRRQMQEPVEPVETPQAARPRGLASPKRSPTPPVKTEYEPLNFTRNALRSIEEARRQFERDMDRMQAEAEVERPPSVIETLTESIRSSDGPAVEEGSTSGLFPLGSSPEITEEGIEVNTASPSTPRPQGRTAVRELHVDLSSYDMPEEELMAYAQSIKDIESSGGNYQARGPVVRTGRYAGERAMGAYQVMPGNLPQWSRQALGREVSEEEFMESPEIQDAIFLDQATRNYRRHGSWEDAASIWFTGQPVSRSGNRSDGYTTAPQYINRFSTAFNRYLGASRG